MKKITLSIISLFAAMYFSQAGAVTQSPPTLSNDTYYGKSVSHPMSTAPLENYQALYQSMTKDKLNESMTRWPVSALKAFMFRKAYYEDLSQSSVELYSSREDEYPHIITFWMRNNSSENLVNSQLFVSDVFKDRSIENGAEMLKQLRTQFMDQGYALSKVVKLSELDTSAIGLDKKSLYLDESSQIVEIQMEFVVQNGRLPHLKDKQVLTLTLLPELKNGKLAFSNIAIFFTEYRETFDADEEY